LVDAAQFRRTCGRFATGVAIATVSDEEGAPHGMTVNSFTSVSLVPPLVLFCVDYSANLLPMFRSARHYGLSVLSEEQQALSNRFAQRGQDRFDGVAWVAGEHGVPLIPGALAHLECEVRQVIDAGDHAVFIGEVVGADVSPGRPLLYFESGYQRLA
jgi:flavin reductase (DIM6/NTAB) family NADH-FMN oxidoreductase RutF